MLHATVLPIGSKNKIKWGHDLHTVIQFKLSKPSIMIIKQSIYSTNANIYYFDVQLTFYNNHKGVIGRKSNPRPVGPIVGFISDYASESFYIR